MPDGRDVVYLYDGSFDGLLCVVFEVFKNRDCPIAIEENKNVQQMFFCDYNIVKTERKISERVSSAIIEKISKKAWRNIYYVYLSDTAEKGMLCLNYIRTCLYRGAGADMYLNDDCIAAVANAVQRVKNEAHRYIEFIRFSELEGGIYYSEIEPEYHVLPLISRHFQKRLPALPWMIHDIKRRLCLVYNGKECYIANTDSLPLKKHSENEKEYQKLWKEFYNTTQIEERKNERCRMTHMPKKYWRHMTEFGL